MDAGGLPGTIDRLVITLSGAEAAAVKKFGQRPRPDDNAHFGVPFRAFADREFEKAVLGLGKEVRLPRSELLAVKRDGDRQAWPKK